MGKKLKNENLEETTRKTVYVRSKPNVEYVKYSELWYPDNNQPKIHTYN